MNADAILGINISVDVVLGVIGVVIVAFLYITSLAWDSVCDDLEHDCKK